MKAHVYLNFPGRTEEAFRFYADVFGRELEELTRFGDASTQDEALPEGSRDRIMHVRLPLGPDHVLMGSDTVEGMDDPVVGTNVYVSLHPDAREEADRIFAALSEGGTVEAPLADAPWGDYWGAFRDRFGIQWMINVAGGGEAS